MNGHQALIALRRAGRVTAAVFVSDGPAECELDKRWPDPVWGSRYAHVRVDAQDIPEALDLRFAVGLQVHIDGMRGAARARRLHEAFVAAGAKIVGTVAEKQHWIHHG